MEGAVVLVLMIVGVVLATRARDRRAHISAHALGAGHLRHLRSGSYPASCSWCRNTTLARKLIMFERTPEAWQATDLLTRLERCSDTDAAVLATAWKHDLPSWRRICTERCAKEFLEAEGVASMEAFVSCTYCSVRGPAAVARCANCGAPRG